MEVLRMKKLLLILTMVFMSASCEDSLISDLAGSFWSNQGGAINIKIGMPIGGGNVVYIFQAEDTGYVSGEFHGLIAATEDQNSGDGICWIIGGLTYETINGNTSNGIGTGQANTTEIISQAVNAGNLNRTTYAAGICDNYTNTDTGTGVYSDWYLPSREELRKFTENNDLDYILGDTYWSSSEYGSDYPGHAWRMSPGQDYNAKSNPFKVRCFRSFKVNG
jgi:hypothetical protein